jgi:hypothetical protein
MIREKGSEKPIIDLTGPEGNAFVLMGHARNIARQLEIDSKPIIEEMMSGDYEHLIEVFNNHFGEYVILER